MSAGIYGVFRAFAVLILQALVNYLLLRYSLFHQNTESSDQ